MNLSAGQTGKSLNDLPKDIYSLFDAGSTHTPSEDNLEQLCTNLKELIRVRFRERDPESAVLRFSSLGKADRQLWYDAHPDGKEEVLDGKTLFKFLYGDVIELLLVFLTKEAGHLVESEQKEIEVDGIKGHIDAIIDGVLVDIKSASPFGFQKFKKGDVVNDDPFGYVSQLSGYAHILTPGKAAAWVAMDKVSGDICVSPLSSSIIQDNLPAPRISHLKDVLTLPAPPERCHSPVPDGKSGNLKLPTPCSYCKHKFRCHPDLRVFLYSTGPRFLTSVSKTPEVPEVTAP